MIFTDYSKVLVLIFSGMRNTTFFLAKKLLESYLLITEKFLFWSFQEWEIRSLLSQKVDGKMIFTCSFWAFHDIPGLGKYGFWITQTINTNNLTTTSAKSINLHTTRTLFEYSWKKVGAKAMFILIVLEISLSEGRLVLRPSPWWPSQGAKALKFQ